MFLSEPFNDMLIIFMWFIHHFKTAKKTYFSVLRWCVNKPCSLLARQERAKNIKINNSYQSITVLVSGWSALICKDPSLKRRTLQLIWLNCSSMQCGVWCEFNFLTCLMHINTHNANSLQFFSIVYTQILVLETQWPQHVTHSPTPWTNSTKLHAQFLLYTQIAVLKHTFFKTLHTILCFWQNFHAENILFSQGTHCHSNMHTDSSQGQTPVTQFYN